MPRTGETVLYLATASGAVDAVPAGEFVQRLGRLGGGVGLPHLIFIAGCNTARPEVRGSAGGLTLRLAQDLGTPAVVAMTDRVSIATIETMVGPFYRRLTDHGLVDLALSEACSQMTERSDLMVPVLYSRLHGKSLFQGQGEHTIGERRITDRIVGAPTEPGKVAQAVRRAWPWSSVLAVGVSGALALWRSDSAVISSPVSAPPLAPAPAPEPVPEPPPIEFRYDLEAKPSMLGVYAREYVMGWIEPFLPRLSACFAEHLPEVKDPRLSVYFDFDIGADGLVMHVTSAATGDPSPKFDACVGETFRGVALDRPSGAVGRIRLQFAFTRVPLQ